MLSVRWRLLAALTVISAAWADPGSQVRRLTHSQYNNTVRDLLNDQTRPADAFAPEDFVNGFKNQAAAQGIPPLLADAYHSAAVKLARSAFLGGDDRHGLIPCKPRSAADAECAAGFVREFGRKAFRRPLTKNEVDRYTSLLGSEARKSGQFVDGARLVVEAMLQSPKFLFRLQTGPPAYSIASRLSYFLWDSMPDEALFRAAASGELNTAPGVEKAIRRMLGDARARQSLDEFVSQWLRFDLVLAAVKDRRRYPQFTPQLALAMTEETRRLVADAVWNDRNFMDIFTADYAFVNSELAAVYKLPPPPEEFERVKFPADSDRAGILGAGMFLAATSKPDETSPTIRGFAIREQFLCEIVPDPPPGTNMTLPPITAAKPMTTRERLREHTTNPSCAGCHGLMDTIGFGLEKYDAIGQRREKQEVSLAGEGERRAQAGRIMLDLDARGTVIGIANSEFSSPKELGRILAGSAQCQECIVKQLFRYGFGRKETSTDRGTIQKGLDVFRNSQFRLKELIAFLATELAFSERRN
jgi:hypothetical protein